MIKIVVLYHGLCSYSALQGARLQRRKKPDEATVRPLHGTPARRCL